MIFPERSAGFLPAFHGSIDTSVTAQVQIEAYYYGSLKERATLGGSAKRDSCAANMSC